MSIGQVSARIGLTTHTAVGPVVDFSLRTAVMGKVLDGPSFTIEAFGDHPRKGISFPLTVAAWSIEGGRRLSRRRDLAVFRVAVADKRRLWCRGTHVTIFERSWGQAARISRLAKVHATVSLERPLKDGLHQLARTRLAWSYLSNARGCRT
jgi:hypothetical protein